MLTREAHLNELADLRDNARAKGQLSAAIRAEELRGRLCWHYDEPKLAEVTEGRRPYGRTSKEEALFEEAFAQFALAVSRSRHSHAACCRWRD